MSGVVVLEGPDRSGKSTLATATGLEIVHFGGPPSSSKEFMKRCERFMTLCENGEPVLCDRSPIISEIVYGLVLRGFLAMSAYELLDKLRNFCLCGARLVYCRPPDEVLFLRPIEEKPHKPCVHVKDVKENRRKLVSAYDFLMSLVKIMMGNDFAVCDGSPDSAAAALSFIKGGRNA